jgi:hypothetical protein
VGTAHQFSAKFFAQPPSRRHDSWSRTASHAERETKTLTRQKPPQAAGTAQALPIAVAALLERFINLI